MDSTDTRFIINEEGKTLYDRFNLLTKNVSFFDFFTITDFFNETKTQELINRIK